MITIDASPTWRDIARISEGETLALAPAAWARVAYANQIVARIVENGIRAYGVNTGVGALSNTVVEPALQQQLSRNIIFSHACGVGDLLPEPSIRAIICSASIDRAHPGGSRLGQMATSRSYMGGALDCLVIPRILPANPEKQKVEAPDSSHNHCTGHRSELSARNDVQIRGLHIDRSAGRLQHG
jgi:histidine ammonia-lyase